MADSAAPPPLSEILPDLEVGRIEIVDVGAMQEDEARYARLLATGAGRLTGFEPNPEERAKLEASLPGAQFLPYFLGNGEPGQFRQTHYPGCSSLYRPNAKVIDRFSQISTMRSESEGMVGNFHVVSEEPVQTHRLDDVAECPAPDWLKLDIQGAELDVLQHGTGALASAMVVEVEVEFVEVYEGQPLFGAVQEFLSTQGLTFHKFVDLGGRTYRPIEIPQLPRMPMSQLLWADAVYVRSLFDLDAYEPAALRKLALILHDGYRSLDLVHLILAEHDRRAGTAFVAPYRGFLQQASFQHCLVANFKA